MMRRQIFSLALGVLSCITSAAKTCGSFILLDRDKSLERQVVISDAVYVIKDTFTLDTHFKLPQNCTLFFQGGKLTGSGVLEGNTTYIEASPTKIFGDELSVRGTWSMGNAYCEWFGGNVANDDNAIPIQKCIDSFNLLSLNTGVYRVKHTINVVKDGCLINGVSRTRSEIQKISTAEENLNAVFMISNTRSKNIQQITMKDLRLSSIGFNVDYGIYTEGINSSEFRNLTIFQCKNGFYCNNETHGALWNLIFDNIEFNSNTLRVYQGKNHYGYNEGESCGVTCITNGGASILFNKCWARDCAVGFHLKGIGYSQLNMCSADNIHGVAYLIEFCRLSMNDCGMENVITSAAVHLYQSQITMIGFNDYQMIAKPNNEIYRVKVDGGKTTFINCFFSEWKKLKPQSTTYGITANYGARVVMNNTSQPKDVIRKYDQLNGATIKYIGE